MPDKLITTLMITVKYIVCYTNSHRMFVPQTSGMESTKQIAQKFPIYLRWILISLFQEQLDASAVYREIYNTYDYDIITEAEITELYDSFMKYDPYEIMGLLEFDVYRKDLHRFLRPEKLPRQDIPDLSWLSESDLDAYKRQLTSKHPSGMIPTPVCYVMFPNGGNQYSVPVPTDIKDKWRSPTTDPIEFLFEKCIILMKVHTRCGRRMSIHEILCDMYDLDPKTMWLSDDDLIMLPLWKDELPLKGYIQTFSIFMHKAYYNLFHGYNFTRAFDHVQEFKTNNDIKLYSESFYTRVVTKLLDRIIILCQKQARESDNYNVKRKEMGRDFFIYSFYAFIEVLLDNLKKNMHEFKSLDVLPYYANLWTNLVNCILKIIKKLKCKFKEDEKEKFARLFHASISQWKRIWFTNDLMPRLINQIYVDATEKNINMSHLITPEILFSYKLLHIYNDNLPIDFKNGPTKFEYYHFFKWHAQKFSFPYQIQENVDSRSILEEIDDAVENKILEELMKN